MKSSKKQHPHANKWVIIPENATSNKSSDNDHPQLQCETWYNETWLSCCGHDSLHVSILFNIIVSRSSSSSSRRSLVDYTPIYVLYLPSSLSSLGIHIIKLILGIGWSCGPSRWSFDTLVIGKVWPQRPWKKRNKYRVSPSSGMI